MAAIKQTTTGKNLASLASEQSLALAQPKQRGVKAQKVSALQTPTIQTSTQATQQGIANIARASSVATQALATKLSNFSNFALQHGNAMMQREAREKATQDVMSNKKVAVDLSTMYGQAYSSAAMATYSAEVSLDAKLKASAFKNAANGNAEAFKLSYEAYEQQVLANAPNEESRVVAQRKFKAYRETGYSTILSENDKRDKSYQTGVYQKNAISTTTDVINLLNNGLPSEAEEAMTSLDLQGHALVQDGAISESQRLKQSEKVKSDIQRETHRFSFNKIVDGNVIQAQVEMDLFNQEIPEGMNVATHRAISSDMKSSIITKIRATKANKKAQFAFNDSIAEKAIIVLDSGKIPIDYQSVLELELSPKMQVKLGNSIALLDATKEFNAQTIPQQETSLNIMRSIEHPTAGNVVKMQHLEKLFGHNISLAKNDPISLGIEQGFIVPPEPVSPGNMDALSNRMQTATQLSTLYGTEPKLLTKHEAEQFQNSYQNGDYKQKMDIVSGIVSSLDSASASKVFTQIAKKGTPQIKYTGIMVASGNRNIAEIAAKGENVKVPMPSGFNRDIIGHIGNALEHTKEGTTTYLEGGANYYKGKALISGEEYNVQDALEESLGVKATYNGKDILLPSGKDKGDFEDYINLLTPQSIPNVLISDKEAFVNQLKGTTDFWITGKSNDIKYMQKGYGRYGVTIKNQNVMQELDDGSVVPFILEFR